ncbi:hypothetical protein E9232_001130 [Inquilinus ginsengisoli]|uniref:HK97 gp10 family phage protein n=1 Tax=Inquilinus ginsengisoli TaxID=363840 RepID=A0ABU1JJW1_9PROT|nr:hypothetical protein [Inquilinus ginsengisoli]MDR6288623.1 hypothetical protein [Inquilinus ginsengisoli]
MITIDVTGLDAEFADFEKQMIAAVADEVESVVTDVHERILDRSPVDTGEFVASWRVSRDTPELVSNGPVGPETPGAAQMALGTEPNRAAAEAISRASRDATDFSDPFRQFWISNASPQAIPIEYGDASKRAPAGVARLAVEEVAAGVR